MLISQSEWARQQGFTRQYVNKLVSRGLIRLVDGKVDPAQAEAALTAIREPAREPQRKVSPTPAPVVVPPPVRSAPPQPTASKPASAFDLPGAPAGDLPTLLLKARIKSEVKRASLLEIREKVETGRLVEADEVKAAAFNRGRAVRAAWEAWPNRVAGTMAAELGVEARPLRLLLERFVRQHLLELSGLERDGDE